MRHKRAIFVTIKIEWKELEFDFLILLGYNTIVYLFSFFTMDSFIIMLFRFIIAAILTAIIMFLFYIFWKKNWWNSYKWYKLKEYFFSYHENIFYKNLKEILDNKRWNKYDVFPKVRLADIMDTTDWKKWITKIWSKHIDFLIVDKTKASKMILAIELNGPSHWSWRKSQIKSDEFKNNVFEGIWLPLHIFYNKQAWNKNEIFEWIKEYLEPIDNKDFAVTWGTVTINQVIEIPPIDQFNKEETIDEE